jgi:hypothetical protein
MDVACSLLICRTVKKGDRIRYCGLEPISSVSVCFKLISHPLIFEAALRYVDETTAMGGMISEPQVEMLAEVVVLDVPLLHPVP